MGTEKYYPKDCGFVCDDCVPQEALFELKAWLLSMPSEEYQEFRESLDRRKDDEKTLVGYCSYCGKAIYV